MTFFSDADSAPSPPAVLIAATLVGLALLTCAQPSFSHAKQKPVKPPDLRILEVSISPLPYLPPSGSLQLTIEVELPAELNGTSMLEVSSLITSASRHSLRFLSNRQSVEPSASSIQATLAGGKPRMLVTLTWDGTDQTMRRVEKGLYSYEIRAKLLSVGENGPRTQMVSWPKRGTIDVK